MNRHIRKLLALTLSLITIIALAACGSTASSGNNSADAAVSSVSADTHTEASSETSAEAAEEQRDWTGFHQWLDEDWDSKNVSFQLTGFWDMGDPQYGKAFSFLMNLYTDGSVQVLQYQPGKVDYRYYGSWDLTEDPDGDELNINMAEMHSGIEGEALVGHRYAYTLYARADGSLYLDYDFGIAPGQYFRVAKLSGSDVAKFETISDFMEAAGSAAEASAPDETASEAPASETYAEPAEISAAADEAVLFSWKCDEGTMVFNKDCTYVFNCGSVAGETGTWAWTSWKIHVTNANGLEMISERDKADNTLHLTYISSADDQLTVHMAVTSDVWSKALGTTGSYELGQ